MPNVHDVAGYILSRRSMTAMKMQKLVYYSQAWHLAREGVPLFSEPIEAWVNGPVVRELYDVHRGQFSLSGWSLGDPEVLSAEQRMLIDEVMDSYGGYDAATLSRLTHREDPWRIARTGVPDDAPSSAVIDPDVMRTYYAAAQARGDTPAAMAAAT